eukprot:CAMPEP_0184696980 /NCGR_PEP_ID=MMETSP0313-20130426/4122_1 /TAXON_ID=2792 /ORGANISM="Porphyridium aerugineum, Strain SAG 1380-2" /LENGTH=251 /DNA_ID=CAMNT_0027155739 /DNA_START=149 /DNA_END=904 /DNA_ORIENTATION=+
MAKDEGLGSFWAGISPALYRNATYSALRIGMYEPIRGFFSAYYQQSNSRETSITQQPHEHQPIPFRVKVAAAILSGAMGALVGSPFELIKVRCQSGHYGYPGTIPALRSIVQHEGVSALWNGVMPNLVRASLLTASQLATYDESKSLIVSYTGLDRTSLLVQLSGAMLAGLVTTTVTSPADVVKTRMMNSRGGTGAVYVSSLGCLVTITKEEGLSVLFKGWVPNYARLGPQTVLSLLVYDYLRRLLGWEQI